MTDALRLEGAAYEVRISDTIARDYQARGVFPKLHRRVDHMPINGMVAYRLDRPTVEELLEDAKSCRATVGRNAIRGIKKSYFSHMTALDRLLDPAKYQRLKDEKTEARVLLQQRNDAERATIRATFAQRLQNLVNQSGTVSAPSDQGFSVELDTQVHHRGGSVTVVGAYGWREVKIGLGRMAVRPCYVVEDEGGDRFWARAGDLMDVTGKGLHLSLVSPATGR